MGAVQSNKRKNEQVKKKTDRKDEFQKQSAPNIYESSKDSARSGASRLFGNALQGVRKNKGHESEDDILPSPRPRGINKHGQSYNSIL